MSRIFRVAMIVGICIFTVVNLEFIIGSNQGLAAQQSDMKIVSKFDPFRDIRVSSSSSRNAVGGIQPMHMHVAGKHRFSSFRCRQSDVSLDKGFEPCTSRSCVFHNLYYHRVSKSFHYFSSPEETRTSNASVIEEKTTVSSGYILDDGTPEKTKKATVATKWFPKVHTNESLPTLVSSIDTPVNPVFLLYVISYSFNFGHFVFDDALSLFTLLDYFGYTDKSRQSYQMIPLPVDIRGDPYFRCQFRMYQCNKMLAKVMPSILGIAFSNETSLLTTDNLGGVDTADSEWLLLPTVIAGTGRTAHFACRSDCAIHRTEVLFRFRRWMFQNLFGEVDGNARAGMVATPGKITISLPVGNSHAGVQSFEQIIPALKAQFGNENVGVYDMSNLTIQEQAELISQTQVLLSNSGGGSASSLFLPRGSSLILYHLKHIMNDKWLYDSVAYFHPDWLPCDAPLHETLSLVEKGLQIPYFR